MARRPVLWAVLITALVAPPVADARSSAAASLQVALRAKGTYAGTVDGIRGPGTR